MKKSLLLIHFLVASVCYSLAANPTVQVGGIYYEINTSGTNATVVKDQSGADKNYPGMTTATIVATVPYSGHNYDVTAISSTAFNNCPDLEEVTVPTSITSIGNKAFYNCLWLERINWNAKSCSAFSSTYSDHPFYNCNKINTIVFGNGVQTIPSYACYSMSNLASVTIPSSVTKIGSNAFAYCKALTSVTLPNSITSIGSSAFYYCQNLESLNIPTSLTSISEYLCYKCNKLSNVVLHEGLETIGKYAFQETAITEITIPSTATGWGYAPFKDCASLKTIVWKPVQVWGTDWDGTDFPFSGCSNVSSFTFADNVQYVPRYICYNMDLLTEIHIPSTVTQIGAYAFEYCDGLTSVELPNKITLIGYSAFNSCKNLESINIPTSLTEINEYMCGYCKKLKSIVIPEGVQTIGRYAFLETAITEITIPSTVTSFGYAPFKDCASLKTIVWKPVKVWGSDWDSTDFPFSGCSNVTSFTFADNVEYVPRYICYNMDLLTEIQIPSTVTQIGANAFAFCDGLTSMTLPNGITLIGNSAFNSCKNLESLNIPTSLTSISQYLCACCKKLTGIVLPEGLETINSYAFQETAITEITIPSTVTSYGDAPFKDCASLKTIVWKPVKVWGSDWDSTDFPFSGCSNVTSFTFADNVEYVPRYICYNMDLLTEIQIPSTVTQIGANAFAFCDGLTSMTLPNGITLIGNSAFNSCKNLESLNIPTSLTSISTSLCAYCKKLTGIVLPEGLETINSYAFQETAITEITIPSTVNLIYTAPFKDCMNLTSIVWKAKNFLGSDYATNTHPFYMTYSSNSKVTSVTFAEGVETIPYYICYYMPNLVNLTIPSTVTRIGMSSFSSCTSLTEVVLPEGLTSVGSQAFSNCSNLTSINIPTTLNSISTRFVSGCSKLTRIDLHEGITSIGAEAFQNTGITSITLPTTLTSMSNAPFSNCKSLTNVVWKATNTTCGSATNTHPFYGCTALKNLTFSRNVTNIPNYAFYGASAMEKIVNYALTPQTINANVFTNVNKETCELWIPKVSFSLYENKDVWKEFFVRKQTEDVTNELTESACEYYMWAGEKITESGDYIKTFISDGGQDSIVTLHLTINHASAGSETVKINGLYYSLGTTTATLTSDQSSDKSVYKEYITVTIPASVTYSNYTYPVKTIGTSAFEGCSNLQSVTLPASITTINTDAFYGCTKLGSVNLEEGLTTINQRAFYNCNLTSVTIPSTVTSIGNGAFKGNPLTTVVWTPANCTIGTGDDAPFYSTSSQITKFTFGEQVTTVPSYLCRNMSKIDTIVLPPSVKSLGQYAFAFCTSLKSINLPVTQKTLPTSFLEGCTALESIELPATLTTISTDVFYGCSKLSNVNLHEGITTINQRAFYNCKLTSVTIPSTVTSIGNGAFKGNPLTTVVWKPVTCTIGTDDSAPFYSTSSQITKFTFGEQVETVPSYLCKNMSKIDTVVLPPSVKSLGQYAFAFCTSLKSINLPVTQKTLPTSFLEGCTALESIELPATLTTISTDVFYGCSKLSNVSLHEGITTINQRAFWGCNLTAITIPSTVTSVGNGAFKGNPLTTIVWKPANCTIGTGEDAPFYNTDSKVTSFTFGENVEVIPSYLCYKMAKLDTIALTAKVTKIDSYAFNGCSALKGIKLHEGITSVGQYAFAFCTSLKNIEFPKGITTVATSVLEGCTALNTVMIPASVTTINQDAFYGCSALQAIHNYAIAPQTITERAVYNVNKQTCILYVPMDYIDLYRTKAVWCDFKNIIGVATDLQFEEQIVQLSYLKKDESVLYMETQTWQIPHAPHVEGFTFEKWEVLAGDLNDGIQLQAVYTSDQPTGAPAVYTNPANPAQKLIRRGNVYVLQDGKTYTVNGTRVE